MKIKPYIISMLLCLTIILQPTLVLAWLEEVTHPDMSEIAVRNSVLGKSDLLNNLGYSKGIDSVPQVKGNN